MDNASNTSKGLSPITSFAQLHNFNVPQYLYDAIISKEFVQPSPIQAAVWPYNLRGLDVIGIAETGMVFASSTFISVILTKSGISGCRCVIVMLLGIGH